MKRCVRCLSELDNNSCICKNCIVELYNKIILESDKEIIEVTIREKVIEVPAPIRVPDYSYRYNDYFVPIDDVNLIDCDPVNRHFGYNE